MGKQIAETIQVVPTLTALNGVTLIVGSVIGSGIFVAPTAVVKDTGSYNAALVVWISAGIYCIIGAYCYIELGLMMPQSGGDYIYVRETLGPFFGFMKLWIDLLIVRPVASAVIALTFGFYSSKAFFPDCDPPEYVIKTVACTAIIFLMYANIYSTKLAVIIQDYTTFGKLIALFVLICAGLYQLYHGKVEHFTWEGTNTDFKMWALSYYVGLFSYNSWTALNSIVNEMINPVRDFPIAMFSALCLVTGVYAMTNVAFYTTLSKEEFLKSVSVASSFAKVVFGGYGWLIPICVSISAFGALNGKVLSTSRVFYAAAHNKEMPHILKTIHVYRLIPQPGIIAYTITNLIYMIIPSKHIFAMIHYAGFANWLAIGFTVFCLVVLRYTKPDMDRPIKVHLAFPIVFICCTLIIVIAPVMKSPYDTGMSIVIILTSIPIYFMFVKPKRTPKWLFNSWNCIERLSQKVMLCGDED